MYISASRQTFFLGSYPQKLVKPATPLSPMVSASTEEEGCLLRDYLALPPREWEGVGADSPELTHPEPQWCSLRHSSAARCHGVIRKPVEAFLPRTLRSTLGFQLLSLQDCFRHGVGGALCGNSPLQGRRVPWRGSPCPVPLLVSALCQSLVGTRGL